MTARSTRLDRKAGLALLLLAVSLLAACGGETVVERNDFPGAGTPIVLLEAPSPTSAPTRVPPAAASTPTALTARPAEPVDAQDVIAMMQQALTREGSVYHATIEQAITSMSPGGIPRWSGELWLDVPGNAGRVEVRLHPDAPTDLSWLDADAATTARRVVFSGNESYVAHEAGPVVREMVAPCPRMGDFSLIAYLICRSPVSPWTARYSIYSLDELRIDQGQVFNGQPALALSYGKAATASLYLDPQTYLPLGWQSNIGQRGALETTFVGEFVDAGSLDPGLFEPASIGYVEPSVATGKLLFTRSNGIRTDVFTINADGSGETNLTNHPGENGGATWSPDGGKIAFTSNRDGNIEIYVMNADGSGVQNLTSDVSTDINPVWSPDGSKLLFVSDREEQFNFQLHVMSADGAGARRLSDRPWAQNPVWSSDGSRIAFVSREVEPGLYIINADGTDETHLTDAIWSGGPYWMPGDASLIYTSLVGSNFEIVTLRTDGSELTNLTNSPGNEFLIALSPDGARIAFVTDQDNTIEQQDIISMNVDGSGQVRLARSLEMPACYGGCVWAPDGTYFAYTVLPQQGSAAMDGNAPASGEPLMLPSGIFLVSADGTVATRLDVTGAAGLDWAP